MSHLVNYTLPGAHNFSALGTQYRSEEVTTLPENGNKTGLLFGTLRELKMRMQARKGANSEKYRLQQNLFDQKSPAEMGKRNGSIIQTTQSVN